MTNSAAGGQPLQQDVLAEGERLIIAAFNEARAKGVPDWQRMTSAVLKNRILTLTDRQFTEERWNARTFRQFLAQYPHLVAVDASHYPPLVELVQKTSEVAAGGAPVTATVLTSYHRIRPDLWRAVLDYSSGQPYVWDKSESAAVATSSDQDPRPTLPTVDEQTFASWREEFASAQSSRVPPREAQAIQRWTSEGLPTSQLPASVRGLWNAELKRRVIETVETWFTSNQLAVPDDLVLFSRETGRPGQPRIENLRDFVHACVAVMTKDELEALGLPAAAVLRMRR